MKTPSFTITGWLLLAGVGMMWLPKDMQAAFRLAVGDVVQPGCRLWEELQARVSPWTVHWSRAADNRVDGMHPMQQELDAARLKLRQLELQLAQQQAEADLHRLPLFVDPSRPDSTRLAAPELISAAVLGDPHAHAWRKGRWLDQGKSTGLLEEAPILTSSEPLIDVGRDAQLSAEDAVLLGRAVIGKVQQVGRWTSTFLLITDAEFRSRAQLVRETPDGYVFGAKGVLKGNGDTLCRLEGIPATDTVEVGNTVYTAERDGLLPTPFYYGQVVEASLEDHAKEWRILVKPVDLNNLTKVQVVRMSLNSRRVFSN